jgi:hypothetical protein
MSPIAQQVTEMINMLPEDSQTLIFELTKKLVLAWDPDFTKVTPAERARIEQAANDEYYDENEIDWN